LLVAIDERERESRWFDVFGGTFGHYIGEEGANISNDNVILQIWGFTLLL